jgi:hypothetical protein
MKAKLTAIGDEHGLIIDKKVLELLKIGLDTELEVSTDAGCLIIEPAEGAPRLERRRAPGPPRGPNPAPVPRPVPVDDDAKTIRLPKKEPW